MEFKTLFICRHLRFWESWLPLGRPCPEPYACAFCFVGDITPLPIPTPHPCQWRVNRVIQAADRSAQRRAGQPMSTPFMTLLEWWSRSTESGSGRAGP